jgi:5-methylcytosine-specific restriction protein B
MRIHITSFSFGNRIIDKTATPGWGSNIGNINADPDKYEYLKYPGLSEIVNGMIKNDKSNDIAYLDFEKMSKNREILKFSIFNKVFVNNKLIPDASYILAIVKENTKSHPGRISLTYPGYYKYSGDGNQVHNQETLSLIEKEIKCQEGCWFVYDVSVGNDVELHFKAKVVSKNRIEYESTADRRKHWESLVNDFSDIIKQFKSYCLKIRRMKNESSANDYVKAMPKVKDWFLENNICGEDFQIWDVYNDLSHIKFKLEGDLKEAWKDAAKKNENGDYGFKMAAWNRWTEFIDWYTNVTIPQKSPDMFKSKEFSASCELAGLIYSHKLIDRFLASLLTKPFVILTGLSGSGKTKLAQAFVQWICQEESQYRIIPVGADWTNREPLLGYPNALKPEEYVKPDNGVIDLIIKANSNPELPHFLILDEMNLSHVERYFADFLSVMESNEEIPLYADGIVDNGIPSQLKVPANLFIIGTVNIDETTNMFSPKVLDRANTIEFRINDDEMKNFLASTNELNMDALLGKGAHMAQNFIKLSKNKSFTNNDREVINKSLISFFGELQKTGAEFGYRSATEILRLINQLDTLNNKLTTLEKLDIAIMQKLLPKLHGSRRKLSPILETLGSFCVKEEIKVVKDVFEKDKFDYSNKNVLYPLSLEKISRMYKGALDNGFASFAEA